MAEKTECNYEEMQAIVKQFQSEAEAINQLLNQTRGKAQALHGDQWVGRGANQFNTEMEQLVLPAMGRLVNALHQAANTANRILQTYQEAEEEASNAFKTLQF
jgi:WXG100 family type VII secretion target